MRFYRTIILIGDFKSSFYYTNYKNNEPSINAFNLISYQKYLLLADPTNIVLSYKVNVNNF